MKELRSERKPLHLKAGYCSQLKSSDSQIDWRSQFVLEGNTTYDLAIVGSGISCAYTLIHYLYLLSKKIHSSKSSKVKPRTIRVAILDKSGEFWTGVAYGKRSGKQTLIITPLKEFLPQPERDRFITWLKKNYDSVLDNLQQREGLLSKEWLKSYQKAIDFGNWNDLFIPRYLFGWYLQEHVASLLQQAQNYLRCDLITADVCNIYKRLKNYQLDTTEGNYAIAKKVVLAIGSPPNKVTFLEKSEFLQLSSNDICCIANMYEPNQTSNLTKISNCLQANSDRTKYPNQVLIIGSNASALETIYSLNNLPQVANSIDKFIVVSSSGAFPHRITDSPTSSTYVAKNLELLSMRSNFTAKQIYQAVKQDVRNALDENETVDSTYPIISQGVIKALNRLERSEQKQFVIKYGVKIGKFQRRAGIDYLNVVDKLMFEGKLEFIKGKFIDTIPISDGNFGFKFVTPTSEQPQLYTNPVRIIINCAGFQDLTKSSSSPLINSLIQQGICTPNDSKCGFEINENFEAHQNLYSIGPLIAGNINDRFKVWHAESCGRIFNLSRNLAEIIFEDINNSNNSN